jgi:hypothetical protein
MRAKRITAAMGGNVINIVNRRDQSSCAESKPGLDRDVAHSNMTSGHRP